MVNEMSEIIIEIYKKVNYSPLVYPRIELDNLFRDLTGRFTIGLKYGLTRVLKRAYQEDRDSLRKALIAIIINSTSYFRDQILKYPSLKFDYEKKISKNDALIEELERLW